MKVSDLVNILDKSQEFRVMREYTNEVLFSPDTRTVSNCNGFQKIKDYEVTSLRNYNGDEFTIYIKNETMVR